MTKTATKSKPKSITVIGRRWFQKTYGNTYCSAEVLVDGVPVAKLGPAYGYGEYYLQLASEWLEAEGYIKPKNYKNGGHEPLWAVAARTGFVLSRSVSDVKRERDL